MAGIVHRAWAEFESGYERRHRPTHGPLRPDSVAVVRQFYRYTIFRSLYLHPWHPQRHPHPGRARDAVQSDILRKLLIAVEGEAA